MAAQYIQIADINASETSTWFPNASLFYGWPPIGNVQSGPTFTGIFNGQGYTIDGLFINRYATNYVGLFAGLGGSGIIKNVVLTNVNITGKTSVGALVGYNSGTTTINNCYTKGSVTGTGNDVGGFLGHSNSGANINNCYSTANASGSYNVGGFVGTNESSTIINCYSMGNASGTGYIGGLVGVNTLTITNCYSTGKPSGSIYVGGLVGSNSSSVNNCFWDKETSELTSSAGGTGKTTTEMKTLITFTNAGWDFTTSPIWKINASLNSGYPYLAWAESVDPALPVELTSFNVTIVNNGVYLNWQTATEVNNYGFEVERSKNDNWQKIGFVQGHGNSNSPKEYSFIDKPFGDNRFYYRLKQIDTDGKYEYSPEVEVSLNVPSEFSVKQNFPNPFNPTTKIEFSIPLDNHVEIKVYNVLGMEVASLLNERSQAGRHSVEFNASNLASGIYFYKVVSGKYSETKKMILLR